jgi:hypothetical protein
MSTSSSDISTVGIFLFFGRYVVRVIVADKMKNVLVSFELKKFNSPIKCSVEK